MAKKKRRASSWGKSYGSNHNYQSPGFLDFRQTNGPVLSGTSGKLKWEIKPYKSVAYKGTGWGTTTQSSLFPQNMPSEFFCDEDTLAMVQNLALGKLHDSSQNNPALTTALAERHKTLSLVTGITANIRSGLLAIKRRDMKEIRKILKRAGVRNKDRSSWITSPAKMHLAFWFGVMPTLHDMNDAAHVFSAPLPSFTIEGKATLPFKSGNRHNPWLSDFPGERTHRLGVYYPLSFSGQIGRVSSRLSCDLTLESPHTVLASRVGLLSPLSVAFELTPWSWAADYFGTFADVIKNFEPQFAGFKVSNKQSTIYSRGQYLLEESTFFGDSPLTIYGGGTVNFWVTRRTLSLPSYSFVWRNRVGLKQASYLAAATLIKTVPLIRESMDILDRQAITIADMTNYVNRQRRS